MTMKYVIIYSTFLPMLSHHCAVNRGSLCTRVRTFHNGHGTMGINFHFDQGREKRLNLIMTTFYRSLFFADRTLGFCRKGQMRHDGKQQAYARVWRGSAGAVLCKHIRPSFPSMLYAKHR